MAFSSDPILYAQGQLYLLDVDNKKASLKTAIQNCRSFPIDYECITDVNTILNGYTGKDVTISNILSNVENIKEKLMACDATWAVSYYSSLFTTKDEKFPELTFQNDNELDMYNEYINTFLYLLNEKEANGGLTEQEIALRNELISSLNKIDNAYNAARQAARMQYLQEKYSGLDLDSVEYNQIENDAEKRNEYLEYISIARSFLLEKQANGTISDQEIKMLRFFQLEELHMGEINRNEIIKNENEIYNSGDELEILELERSKEMQSTYDSFNLNNTQSQVENERKQLAKELGLKDYDFVEKIGHKVQQLGNEWKEGFEALGRGEGIGELWDATTKTGATVIETGSAIVSGGIKVVENVGDGIIYVGGGLVSLAVKPVDMVTGGNASGQIMDGTNDIIRVDVTEELNKAFYENSDLGRYINSQSVLKYDDDVARTIKDAGSFAGKAVLATGATLAFGPAGALTVGALYGIGNSTEKYTQSVDREHGESYNYGEEFLKATAGGVAGSVEFYNLGQAVATAYNGLTSLGAGSVGNGVSSVEAISETLAAGKPNVVKSFVKNMVTKDFVVDTAGTVLSHATNLVAGNETWDEALKGTGADLIVVFGGHGIGGIAGTAAEFKQYRNALATAEEIASTNKYLDSLSSVERTNTWEDYFKNRYGSSYEGMFSEVASHKMADVDELNFQIKNKNVTFRGSSYEKLGEICEKYDISETDLWALSKTKQHNMTPKQRELIYSIRKELTSDVTDELGRLLPETRVSKAITESSFENFYKTGDSANLRGCIALERDASLLNGSEEIIDYTGLRFEGNEFENRVFYVVEGDLKQLQGDVSVRVSATTEATSVSDSVLEKFDRMYPDYTYNGSHVAKVDNLNDTYLNEIWTRNSHGQLDDLSNASGIPKENIVTEEAKWYNRSTNPDTGNGFTLYQGSDTSVGIPEFFAKEFVGVHNGNIYKIDGLEKVLVGFIDENGIIKIIDN